MSDADPNWVALSSAGLGLVAVASLLSGSVPSVSGYAMVALAVGLGLGAVWNASRDDSTK
jgi:hypothetical protein